MAGNGLLVCCAALSGPMNQPLPRSGGARLSVEVMLTAYSWDAELT
jgi:hypothetical protein